MSTNLNPLRKSALPFSNLNTKNKLEPTRTQESDSDDCLCEALCADDLSNVASSDCSCSDCAQALLEAYNEYLMEEGGKEKKSWNEKISGKGIDGKRQLVETIRTGREMQSTEVIYTGKNRNRSTFNRSPRFEIDKTRNFSRQQILRQTCHRDHKHHSKANHQRRSLSPQQHKPSQFSPSPQLEPQTIEVSPTKYDFDQAEMMFYVDQKIKQNLKKHRHKQKNEKKMRQEEEIRKKLALAKLDAERKRRIGELRQEQGDEEKKKFPWNYQMDTKQEKEKQQIQIHCHKIPLKGPTDSGGDRQLITKLAEQRLQQKKKQQKQLFKQQKIKVSAIANKIDIEQKHEKCYDSCKNHHMNTDQKLIIEATKKIQKNAEKYMERMKLQKKEKQEKERMKEGKLRALALKAQQKLGKAKKIGVGERSSFHETIEHFSTFSQLKKAKQEVNRGKEFEKELKEQINPNRKNVHYDKEKEIEKQKNLREDLSELDESAVEIEKPKGFSKQKQAKSLSKQKRNSHITKQAREQTVQQLKNSLNKRIKPRELQQSIQGAIADPNSKFFVWDMPLDDTQVKRLFTDAKIPLHGKKTQSQQQHQPSTFKQEVNRKIEENIKLKLKEKEKARKQSMIEDKVKEKKEQIMKEYRKIREMQTEELEKGKGRGKDNSSQNVTKSKTQTKSNKELQSEFVSKVKENSKSRIKGNHLNNPPNIKKERWDIQEKEENKVISSLQENEMFTTGDKKIFVLNSETLAGVKHLKV